MMRAAYVTELGSPANIQVGELAEPKLGALDVLVRTQALAVNFVDSLVRSGRYPTPKTFPFVIGRDLVGVVTAKGDAVDGFGVGDAVWSNSLGHRGLQGSFAEFAAVPHDRLYPLPDGADPAETVALLHPAGTAYLALFREAGLRYGETVVVSGAAGAVGSTAVQFAAASGAHVIATAREEDAGGCRSAGADAGHRRSTGLDSTPMRSISTSMRPPRRTRSTFWTAPPPADARSAVPMAMTSPGSRVR
jgi:NADPH:quinone reductase-like Zn-dependent oxidoreductase